MPLYQCVLIARNDVTQQQVDGIADNIALQLDADGGAVKKRAYWGLRGLAYRIKKNRKGHYVLLNINAPSNAGSELERQSRINEDVLRYITVKGDQFEQSSNKNKREREDGERKPETAVAAEEAAL